MNPQYQFHAEINIFDVHMLDIDFVEYSVLNILSAPAPGTSPPTTTTDNEDDNFRDASIPFTVLTRRGNKQQVCCRDIVMDAKLTSCVVNYLSTV